MKKIPTLFERTEDRRHVIDVVTPGCEWVLAGEGLATRKWDGTCVMYDGDRWWARREVKPHGKFPNAWLPVSGPDPITGKWVGWEQAIDSPFAKYLTEAVANHDVWEPDGAWEPGTYELCGPRVNGNPEHFGDHRLMTHGAHVVGVAPPGQGPTFALLRHFLVDERPDIEGIVWWHPDGRMAKIKRKDFA